MVKTQDTPLASSPFEQGKGRKKIIDFNHARYLKLGRINPDDVQGSIQEVFIPEERIVSAYKAMRDCVAFTDKRILAVNVRESPEKRSITRPCLIPK